MNGLLQFWINDYFTDLLLTLTLVLVLVLSLTKGKKYSQYKYFPFYFFSFLMLQFFNYSYFVPTNDTSLRNAIGRAGYYIDWTVTIIEYFAFTYFFHSINCNPKKKKIIKWSFVIVTTLAASVVFNDILNKPRLSYNSISTTYVLESLSLMLFCFLYFHELFTKFQKTNLLQDANFWTVTGLTFYSICTLPTTLVLNYYIKIDYLFYAKIFTIIHVFYLLLFALIIKSFSCKTPKLI